MLQMESSATEAWTDELVQQAMAIESITIGITNASRTATNPRAMHELLHSFSDSLDRQSANRRLLYIQLTEGMEPASETAQRIPVAQRSPLGSWSNVTIPVTRSLKETWEQTELATWLPLWKEAFPCILIDLGPVDANYARSVAKNCDTVFMLLGPEECGSPEWLSQQMQKHEDQGTQISGTLLAK